MESFSKNLLEFGSSVDLLATAICDFSTPLRNYKKGEVVLDLKNVIARIYTRQNEKISKNAVNQLGYSDLTLTSLQFFNVPLESQIYNLLGEEEEEHLILYSEEAYCLNNHQILLKNFVEDPTTIMVKDVENFTVNNVGEVTFLTSNDFQDGGYYYVQYYKKYKKPSILLDSRLSDIPYLSLQLAFTGNSNKESKDYYLLVEKAHMKYTPVFGFENIGISNCSLEFNVIDSNKKPKIIIKD